MSYVLINHAEDGTHNRSFRSEKAALKALAEFLGYDHGDDDKPLRINKSYDSDYGNRLIIEERAARWSAANEERLRRAYDARECGTATKAQLAFLDRIGF